MKKGLYSYPWPSTPLIHHSPSPKPKTSSQDIKATVLFIHGLGEHCNRYNHVFEQFIQNGIKVHSFDQRGFGRTVRMNGIHGHNEGFKQVIRDCKAASDRVKLQNVPHFVMGHSMGGGICLRFAIEYADEIQGCIASGDSLMTFGLD